MSELDPRLADLLRRTPAPPTALDAAHRQAVLTAAQQSWFRQRARNRCNLIGLACAAMLAAAIAGWTVRSLIDSPLQETIPVLAVTERDAQVDKVAAPASPPAELAAPAPAAANMSLEQDAMVARTPLAAKAQGPAASAPAPAGLIRSVRAAPAAHGRLVMARLVAEAAQARRLPAADRQAALQAALDSLAGLDVAETEGLRQRLTELLRE